MAEQGRTTLKSYFETGDRPTEAQFADLIDSIFNFVNDNSDNLTEGTVQLLLTVAERAKLDNVPSDTNSELNAKADLSGATFTGLITANAGINPSEINAVAIANYVIIGGDIGGTGAAPVINDEAITNAKLAHIATNRIKGRSTAGTGDVEDLTAAEVKTMLDLPTNTVTELADKLPLAGGTMTGAITGDQQADLFTGWEDTYSDAGGVIEEVFTSQRVTPLSTLTTAMTITLTSEPTGLDVGEFFSFQVWDLTNTLTIEIEATAYVTGIGQVAAGNSITVDNAGDAFTISYATDGTWSIIGGSFTKV